MRSIFGMVVLLTLLSAFNSLPPENLIMKLERRSGSTWEESKSRDRQRMRANFTLGTLDSGLYFTTLKIGSPLREFTFRVNTGSDLSWVSCADCRNCARSNNSLQLYSPSDSSSASVLSCLQEQCITHIPTLCNSQYPSCNYRIQYMDQSYTMGFLVSDIIHLDEHFSTPVVFGCSKHESGLSDMWVDGILGLSHRPGSLISQLSLQVFSHCLSGGEDGGGILILGGIQNPTVEYTRLDTSGNGYRVNLQSIAIHGKIVDINPSVFNSENAITIVNSGTTNTFLANLAYDPVLNALTAFVSKFAKPVISDSMFFQVSKRIRIDDIFPRITFKFEGGASITVQPKDYLTKVVDLNDTGLWSFGFLNGGTDQTTLGALVLRDKIVVYDIAHNRFGWASQNCSKPFNISKDSGARSLCVEALLVVINFLTLFLHLLIFG